MTEAGSFHERRRLALGAGIISFILWCAAMGGVMASEIPMEGLELWLRADQGVEIDQNMGVTVWRDQSGAGADATPQNGGQQPTFVANAENGLPSVRLNDCRMFMNTDIGPFEGLTAFFVIKPFYWAQFGLGSINIYTQNHGLSFSPRDGLYIDTPNPTDVIEGNYQLIVVQQTADGLVRILLQDGTVVEGVKDLPEDMESAYGWIEGNLEVQEVVVYNRYIHISEVLTYLRDKYGLNDVDGDFLPDYWEILHGFDPTVYDPMWSSDADQDGLVDYWEYLKGTDPNDYFNGEVPVLSIVSGNNQTLPPDGFGLEPLVVRVTTAGGEPLFNAPVRFVAEGGGRLALQPVEASIQQAHLDVRSDMNGEVHVWWKAPSVSSAAQRVTVSTGAPLALPVVMNAVIDEVEAELVQQSFARMWFELGPGHTYDLRGELLDPDYSEGYDWEITHVGGQAPVAISAEQVLSLDEKKWTQLVVKVRKRGTNQVHTWEFRYCGITSLSEEEGYQDYNENQYQYAIAGGIPDWAQRDLRLEVFDPALENGNVFTGSFPPWAEAPSARDLTFTWDEELPGRSYEVRLVDSAGRIHDTAILHIVRIEWGRETVTVHAGLPSSYEPAETYDEGLRHSLSGVGNLLEVSGPKEQMEWSIVRLVGHDRPCLSQEDPTIDPATGRIENLHAGVYRVKASAFGVEKSFVLVREEIGGPNQTLNYVQWVSGGGWMAPNCYWMPEADTWTDPDNPLNYISELGFEWSKFAFGLDNIRLGDTYAPVIFGDTGGYYVVQALIYPSGYGGGYFSSGGYALFSHDLWVIKVEAGVDSDNNNGFDLPDLSQAEDEIEEDLDKPGKIIVGAPGADTDGDGVPDFAEAHYGSGDGDNTVSQAPFTPIVFETGYPVSAGGGVKLHYSASDPRLVTKVVEDDIATYTAAPGAMRLWTKPAHEPRNPLPITEGGDYIPPDVTLDMLFKLGERSIRTAYIEMVNGSGLTPIHIEWRDYHGGTTYQAIYFRDTVLVTLIPFEVESKDRVLHGSVEIPEGWTNFSLAFKNKSTGQDLGTFEKLEPGATGSTVKIYDSPEDFFSDEEMEQNQAGTLDDNVKNQQVAFARDPENSRKLEFSTVFDDVGEIEVKIIFGPNQTEGIVTHTLTTDAAMADFVNTMNERVASIEVPGSEELPIDLDGDGSPDGPGVNDLLQGRQPGSMAIPGAILHEDLEDDPLNLVLRINDDDDDGNGQPDNGDAVIHQSDNDVSRLLLKRPGNLAANVGTLTLTVTGGNAVRVFNSSGSAALTNYTVDLANPTGDLAGLAAGSVPIYVEGLANSSEVIFTLTYNDGQGNTQSDSVHLTVAGSSQFALMQMMGGMQWAGTQQVKMRTYAANGAVAWQKIHLAPIGENPPLLNRGMLSKVFWDVTKRSVQAQLAWTKGFVDGFWVALKGEKDTVVGVWNFFRDDPFGRSAAMYGAVKEAIGELKDIPAGEIPGLLSTISKNLWDDLYTQAEQALPWAPVDPPPTLVLKYMEGFAAGTIAEGVGVSLLGVGVVTKTATVVKGIIASCKVGRYALTMLSNLRKATAKTTHILMRLAKSEEGSLHIGAIGKRLEKVELPSGKKATEAFDEVFHDKAELTTRFLQRQKAHWPDITDEARLATRYQKCAHSLAELKDIMGDGLTDDAIEGFGMLQKKLFTQDVDDVDRWPDTKALWKNLDSPQKKESLKKSLEAYKTAAASDPDAKFWIKDLDTVQTKGYRYVTQGELDLINGNGNKLTVHNGKGWYCSLDNYGNAIDAKNALQMPQPSGAIVARIEFDIPNVKNHIRAPFDTDDGNKNLFEFLARAFPDNAVSPPGGGGTQFLIDGAEVPISAIVRF